jgi:hypothetical protein
MQLLSSVLSVASYPIKFSVYKKEAIHKLHGWVDEVNEGHKPLSDPFPHD